MGQLEERDSFVFYKSFYDAIISIPDVETQMEIFKVLCEYSFTGNIPEINNGNVRALFIVMKPVVDKANNRYKANVENGKKGGRPKKDLKNETQNNPSETQNNPSKPNANLNDNDNEDDNDNVNDNNVNILQKPTDVKHKYGKYKHVLLKDQELESLQKDYSNYQELIDFLDEYIEMKGYKAKSHYLCIRRWVADAVKRNNKSTPKGKFANYTQREYDENFFKELYD